jgi:hypothetical protein
MAIVAPSAYRKLGQTHNFGCVMRHSFEDGIAETAAKEWFAFVATIGVAALVWAVFFSPGA